MQHGLPVGKQWEMKLARPSESKWNAKRMMCFVNPAHLKGRPLKDFWAGECGKTVNSSFRQTNFQSKLVFSLCFLRQHLLDMNDAVEKVRTQGRTFGMRSLFSGPTFGPVWQEKPLSFSYPGSFSPFLKPFLPYFYFIEFLLAFLQD